MLKLLLVDDDIPFSRLLKLYLKNNAIDADCVHDVKSALSKLLPPSESAYDVLILDVMMQNESGFDVLKALRTANFDIPVIMLSGCDDPLDKAAALNAGADDYVCKPFESDEFLARIHALLRRVGGKAAGGNANAVLRSGKAEADAKMVTIQDLKEIIDLTEIESHLLEILIRNAGEPVSMEELYPHVIGRDYSSGDRSLSQHVSRLRRKLRSYPGNTVRIKTLHGKGFMYVPPSVTKKS